MKKKIIVGVDEVGRGPLFGPVVASSAVFPSDFDFESKIPGLTDSKKLSEKKRDSLELLIKKYALEYTIAESSAAEIDKINILQASLLAMKRTVTSLSLIKDLLPEHDIEVLIDGNINIDLPYPSRAIIKGDLTEPAISAASILAKQYRDRMIIELDLKFPGYDLKSNKGYPTKKHMAAISEIGITEYHRKSFSPVAKYLELIE